MCRVAQGRVPEGPACESGSDMPVESGEWDVPSLNLSVPIQEMGCVVVPASVWFGQGFPQNEPE